MKKLQIEQMEVVNGGWGINAQTINALACNVAIYMVATGGSNGANFAMYSAGVAMAYANGCV
jgi:hypothetical protein